MWKGNRFEVGDFVFAKLKGHPHWPATISQIETLFANGAPGQEKTRYNVYFYGSHQMSMIKVDSIVRFDDHYDLFKRKYASNSKFSLALQELEADKATREDYVKSLQIVDSVSQDEYQEQPVDEMFVSSEENSDNDDGINSIDGLSYGSANSSGFGDGFDSDDEYQTLLNQKYEILSMEKIPYLGTSDSLLVISLGFRERDLQGDFQVIEEEIRMMSCYVHLERLPMSTGRKKRGPYRKKEKKEIESHTGRKRKRNKWRTGKWNNKPSLTVLAAEAVKRRRRQRKTVFRDESRLLSLRQRTGETSSAEAINSINSCSCLPEKCECVSTEQPSVIICPICQAQFSSSVDFKQHSFNIHIMGL